MDRRSAMKKIGTGGLLAVAFGGTASATEQHRLGMETPPFPDPGDEGDDEDEDDDEELPGPI